MEELKIDMKIFLIVIAAVIFLAPVVVWAYLVSLGCAYNTSATSCGVQFYDYLDIEFLALAAVPWLIAGTCLVIALRMRSQNKS